jgi:hypothetical protein
LPRSTDNSDHPGTLPPPELNPLINPILGQNMGRWAEVYFTSAPEKREEAVLALLRELQAEGSENQDRAASVLPSPLQNSVAQTSAASHIERLQPGPVRCPSCGRENPAQHKFCGMCGTTLDSEPASKNPLVDVRIDDPRSAEAVISKERSKTDFSRNRDMDDPMPAFLRSKLSLTAREELDGVPLSRFPRSYRLYIGSALALLIMALVYIAWRGGQATSQSAGLPPQTPPASAPTHASAPVASAVKPDGASSPVGTRTSQSTTQHMLGQVRQKAVPAAHQNSDPGAPTAASPETETAAGGAKELAIAESYLNGTSGQQRNIEEAVQWLWKAVGKGSASATLELSDVYLSGDGIPKNCDQARVLLHAAASKGMKQAGERLRNLQSFGCE